MSELRSLISARYLSREECEALAKRTLAFVTTADAARVNVTSGSRGNTRFSIPTVLCERWPRSTASKSLPTGDRWAAH